MVKIYYMLYENKMFILKIIFLKVLVINWSFMVDYYLKFVFRKRIWFRKWVIKLIGFIWLNLLNLLKFLML